MNEIIIYGLIPVLIIIVASLIERIYLKKKDKTILEEKNSFVNRFRIACYLLIMILIYFLVLTII